VLSCRQLASGVAVILFLFGQDFADGFDRNASCFGYGDLAKSLPSHPRNAVAVALRDGISPLTSHTQSVAFVESAYYPWLVYQFHGAFCNCGEISSKIGKLEANC